MFGNYSDEYSTSSSSMSLRNNLSEFYKDKYMAFKSLEVGAVIITILCNAAIWLIDCILVDGVSKYTVLPRFICLTLIMPYIFLTRKSNNRLINTAISYIILYIVGMCAVFADYMLPTHIYFAAIMLLFEVPYLACGTTIPYIQSSIWHIGLIIETMIPSIAFRDINSLVVLILQLIAYWTTNQIIRVVNDRYYDSYEDIELRERQVIHDQLTKAYNRTKVETLCNPQDGSLYLNTAAVMMIDIDFFKKVNDEFGHSVGDMVLVNTVDILKSCIRKSDYIIRWGGEEFLIILPNCNIKRAKTIAETMRSRIEFQKEAMCRHTISLGITEYIGGDFTNSLKRADKALYYAKEHGRNQFAVADEVGIGLDIDNDEN